MKTVICSHGFGVRADSFGLFTDIAAAFPDVTFKQFDYDEQHANGDTVVRSLPERVKLLQEQIDAADGEIILLCHSLGCVVAGLVDLSRVSKVILLAPPVHISKQRFVDWLLGAREGSKIDDNGTLVLPRSDGSTTYLPMEFLDSADTVYPLKLYQQIADTKSVVIFRALRDEVIGMTNVDEVKIAQIIDIDSDHNFTGDNREKLINDLRKVIQSDRD